MSLEDIRSCPNDDSMNSYEANQSIKNNTSVESLDNTTSGDSGLNTQETQQQGKQTPNNNKSGKTNSSESGEGKGETSKYRLKIAKKAVSYHDIHSEYTKKRYKHVESKVAKYIADMKALDEKRRRSKKLLVYHSLPETLTVDDSNCSQQFSTLTHSIDVLDCHSNPNVTEQETESSTAFIQLNTTIYEQLLKDKERKDYLQAKLEEKSTENWRLRQNLDIIRIQLAQCQDRLKQHPKPLHLFTNIFGNPTKSTQTEISPTQSPIPALPPHHATKLMDNTPMTPEFQNAFHNQQAIEPQPPVALKLAKCVAAIQPMSLNFSNLLEQTDRDYNDNTILALESKSMTTDNSNNLKIIQYNITPIFNHNHDHTNNDIESVDEAIQIQAEECSIRRQDHNFNQHMQCCNALYVYRNTASNSVESNVNGGGEGKCKRCKRRTVRHRLFHLISSCITCKKLCSKDSGDISGNALKSPYSHVPLLETTVPKRYHSNA